MIQLSGITLANTFKWFIPVKIDSISYHNDVESTLVSYHFILHGWEAIIYNQYEVLVVNCKLKFIVGFYVEFFYSVK